MIFLPGRYTLYRWILSRRVVCLMKKKVTITVTKRNFDQHGNVIGEVEKKYELPLIYAFMAGSLFGSIMAAIGLALQGMVSLT